MTERQRQTIKIVEKHFVHTPKGWTVTKRGREKLYAINSNVPKALAYYNKIKKLRI